MENSLDIFQIIVDNVSIVDVISEYVQLERKGRNHFGLCPFHNEKTPSFSVSEDKKIYKCFSCGEGGNVINFIKEIEAITYYEAARKLSEKFGLNLKFSQNKENKNTVYYKINEESNKFYNFYLNNTKEGQNAKQYLTNRKINQELIDYFSIGLAANKRDLLFKTLESKKIDPLFMMEAGLVKKSNNYYDIFKNRIMFPIKDEFNNVVGFSGRIYNNETNSPKYVNSQETVVFKKNALLYNLNNAKKEVKKTGRIILFEGFMDVIRAVSIGLYESVATMGTSLTENHIKKIKSLTNNVIICFDGDKAGLAASYKSLDILQKYNLNVQVAIVPNKMDPDDYIVKRGKEKFYKILRDNLFDSFKFKYLYLKKDIDLTKALEIEKFKKNIFNLIKDIKSNSIIEMYLKLMEKDLNITFYSLEKDFESFKGRVYNQRDNNPNFNNKPAQNNNIKINIENKFIKAEKTLTNYMLINKKTANTIIDQIGDIIVDKNNYIFRHKLIDYYRLNNIEEISIDSFKDSLNIQMLDYFETELKFKRDKINTIEINDCIETLKDYQYYEMQMKLNQNLKRKNLSEEKKIEIAEKILEFTQKRKKHMR